MKYFLQNIALSSPMRTISCVLIGLALWIVSIIWQENMIPILVTLVLTLINSLLLTRLFNTASITKLFSPFVASTYWLAMSAFPILHSCWQVQLVVLSGIVITTILAKAKYQDNVTEEAFLSTLICCFALPTRVIMLGCIGILWIYLIIKGWMTWRVLSAGIIAIALRVILMIVLHYFGWMEWLWMENLPHLSWQKWIIAGGAFTGVLLATLLPIRRPSTVSGIVYIICLSGVLAIGGWIVIVMLK